MSIDDFFDNGKSQTSAFLVFASGSVDFVKTFPDLLNTGLWDADTMILYLYENFVVFFGSLYGDS